MISRRSALAAMSSALAVVGFDPDTGSWVTEAAARSCRGAPRLDGELVTTPETLDAFGQDLGNMVHNTPIAVLYPGSVRDIQKMIRFAKRFGIEVAARGQGHATFGQAQVRGGLVINIGSLNEIHSIGSDCVDIDAGATWKTLVTEAVQHGLTPRGLTGFTNLSIAGTLSMGGVTPFLNDGGAQVDHVRELEVVTGTGELVRCSATHHSDIFEAALGGLGQCGIITRAVIDLVPAKQMSRTYMLEYSDNGEFFADLRLLLERNEFDGLFNIWIPDGAGGYIYQLNAVCHYDAGDTPNDAELLRGLAYENVSTLDATYLDTMLRVDGQIEYLRSLGLFDDMRHPWFDIFLPDETIEQYVGDVLPSLTPEDVGPFGFMLLLVLKRSKLKRPFFRVPGDTEWVYLFDILTSSATPNPDADYDARMVARNRALFEKGKAMGGYRYPIGTLDFDRSDWRHHYGREYRRFKHLKRRYDPRGILTPGPEIF